MERQKQKKIRCPFCGTVHRVETVVDQKGKRHLQGVFCSFKCERKMQLLYKLDAIADEWNAL